MSKKYECPEVLSLLGVLDTHLRWKNVLTRGDRKYHKYHPSELGMCLRAQQYKHYAQLGLIDVEMEELKSKLLRLFDKGHNMHDRWAKYFEDIGILRGRWQCANKICLAFDEKGKLKDDPEYIKELVSSDKLKSRMYGNKELQGCFKPEKCVCGCTDFIYHETSVRSEEMNLAGHADLVLDLSKFDSKRYELPKFNVTFNVNNLPKGIIVADMKTCNEWIFKNKILKTGAKPEHIIQLILYIHILNCDYGILMYECKNNSEMAWLKIERDDEKFETLKWQLKTMIAMAKSEKKQLPPPRPKTKTCWACKGCDFRNLCLKSAIWKDPDLDKKRKSFYRSLL